MVLWSRLQRLNLQMGMIHQKSEVIASAQSPTVRQFKGANNPLHIYPSYRSDISNGSLTVIHSTVMLWQYLFLGPLEMICRACHFDTISVNTDCLMHVNLSSISSRRGCCNNFVNKSLRFVFVPSFAKSDFACCYNLLTPMVSNWSFSSVLIQAWFCFYTRPRCRKIC